MSAEPRRPSNPLLKKGVSSAARDAPLPDERASLPLQNRLKASAENSALNVMAMLRELLEDFRNQDRFFKYKALIIALWVGLSSTGMAVAWPSGGAGSLGARIVVEYPGEHLIIIIKNDSNEPWHDATMLVNGLYQGSAPLVEPGERFTMTPRQLMGKNGSLAPVDLRAEEVVLRTRHGKAVVLSHGEPRAQ